MFRNKVPRKNRKGVKPIEYIEELKADYVGKMLLYKGKLYNIVGIGYNGLILIDKPNKNSKYTPVYLSYEIDRNIISE